MKKVLCGDIECIHNCSMRVNGTLVLVCSVNDISIETNNDKCDKRQEFQKSR